MKYKFISLVCFLIVSGSAIAGDIAYGTIKGIKVYDFSNAKVTKVAFNSGATHIDEPQCNGTATITHSLHGDNVDRLISVALAAYMSGKKVRAYSAVSGSCEVDMLSVSDSYL